MKDEAPLIYTVGHSNHKIEDFVCCLQENGVTDLVDIRSRPSSRYCPQYNKDRLSNHCIDAGIQYRWKGASLGGFSTPGKDMIRSINNMLEWLSLNKGRKIALMCSEGKYKECHRHWWVSYYLTITEKAVITEIHPRNESITFYPEDFGNYPESFNSGLKLINL